ncbi:V-type ATP synthase subunit I domain-containing protein [Aureispira anguillae]|nr:hypothetical protein [Aureispira anguillae]
MLAKLGKLDKVKNLNYTDYRSLIKKEVKQRLSTAPTTGVFQYVLLAGNSLQWKGDLETMEEQPMLYLHDNSQPLIQSIKKDAAFNLKTYSYGTCRMVQVGNDVQVYICPEKGKLTQPQLLKPIQKVLKKFKPKLFLEIVDDLSTIEPSVIEDGGGIVEGEENGIQAIAKKIGLSLTKYHKAFQQVNEQAKNLAKEDKSRNKILLQRNKLLKHMKHLCTSWADEVQPNTAELSLETNWEKLYAYWSAYFAKQKTTKTERGVNEKELYKKAVKDVERFFEVMDKEDLDINAIEKNLKLLEQHLEQWKKMVDKPVDSFEEELKAFEQIVYNIKNELKEARKKQEEGESYEAAAEALELFMEDMKKYDVTNPSKIEKDIAILEKCLTGWKTVVNTNGKSFYAEDLSIMETAVQRVKKDWEEAQPKLERYALVIKELDVALAANATEEKIMDLLNQAEAIVTAKKI